MSEKSKAAWLSVASNTTLAVFKLIVGVAIGSISVISEALHSGIDLIAALIALFAVKTSGKPADNEHHYGHGKIENISGSVEAVLIFIAAGWIIYEAVEKMFHPKPVETPIAGVAVMFVSTVANLLISSMLFRIGKKTESVALVADAWHLRTDVYTSGGVMLALAAIWILGVFFPHLNAQWIDPVAAILVAGLILKAAYNLTLQAGRDLLDASLPKEENDCIAALIANIGPKVIGFHKLRTRKSGSERFIEFHLIVEKDMTVEAAHKIADELERKIEARFLRTSTTVHIEPCDGSCLSECESGCLLDAEERDKRRRG